MEREVGRVVHFFDRIAVAVVELTQGLERGDQVAFRGPRTDFQQQVDSMQIDHQEVARGKKGEQIALKVRERARKGDRVYRVEG
ncbi:MAG: hypothetical protein RDU89_00155 [bacterium]|nr:hypothetical protein [bacterium]